MLTDPANWYISVSDYRSETIYSSLVGSTESPVLTDAQVKALLLDAMSAVDSYVEEGWTRYDEDQEFIFPRDLDVEDTVVTIPRGVRTATRMVADAMLKRRTAGLLPDEIKSESNAGHSYEKFGSASPDPRFAYWPPDVFTFLDPFRQAGGMLAVV